MTKANDFRTMLKRRGSKKGFFGGSTNKDKGMENTSTSEVVADTTTSSSTSTTMPMTMTATTSTSTSTTHQVKSSTTTTASSSSPTATTTTATNSSKKSSSSTSSPKKQQDDKKKSSYVEEEDACGFGESHRILQTMDEFFASPTPQQPKGKVVKGEGGSAEDEKANDDKKKPKSSKKLSSSAYHAMSSSQLARSMRDLDGVNILGGGAARRPSSSRSLSSASNRSLQSTGSADDKDENDDTGDPPSKKPQSSKALVAANTNNATTTTTTTTTNRRKNHMKNLSADLSASCILNSNHFAFSNTSSTTDSLVSKNKKQQATTNMMMNSKLSQSMSNLGGHSSSSSLSTSTRRRNSASHDNELLLSQSMSDFDHRHKAIRAATVTTSTTKRLSQSDHGKPSSTSRSSTENRTVGRRAGLSRSRSVDHDIMGDVISEEEDDDDCEQEETTPATDKSSISRRKSATSSTTPQPRLRTSSDWIAQKFGTARKTRSSFNTSSSSLQYDGRKKTDDNNENSDGGDLARHHHSSSNLSSSSQSSHTTSGGGSRKSSDRNASLSTLSMEQSLQNLFGGGSGGGGDDGIIIQHHNGDDEDKSVTSAVYTTNDKHSSTSNVSKSGSVKNESKGDESKPTDKLNASFSANGIGGGSNLRGTLTRSKSLYSKPNTNRTSEAWIGKPRSKGSNSSNKVNDDKRIVDGKDEQDEGTPRSLTRSKSLQPRMEPTATTRRTSANWIDQKYGPRRNSFQKGNGANDSTSKMSNSMSQLRHEDDVNSDSHIFDRSSQSMQHDYRPSTSKRLGNESNKLRDKNADEEGSAKSVRNLRGVFDKSQEKSGSSKKLGGSYPAWMQGDDESSTTKTERRAVSSARNSTTRASAPSKFAVPAASPSRRKLETSRTNSRRARSGLVVLERTRQLNKSIDESKASTKAKKMRSSMHHGRLTYRNRLKNIRDLKKASSRIAPTNEGSEEDETSKSRRNGGTHSSAEGGGEAVRESRRPRAPIRTLSALSTRPHRRAKVHITSSNKGGRTSTGSSGSGLVKLNRRVSARNEDRPSRHSHRQQQKSRPARAPQRRKVDMKQTTRTIEAVRSSSCTQSGRDRSESGKSQHKTPVVLTDRSRSHRRMIGPCRRRRSDHAVEQTEPRSSSDHASRGSERKPLSHASRGSERKPSSFSDSSQRSTRSTKSTEQSRRSKRSLQVFPKLPEPDCDTDMVDNSTSSDVVTTKNRTFNIDQPDEELDESIPMNKTEMDGIISRRLQLEEADNADFSDTDSQHSRKRVFHFEDPHSRLVGGAASDKQHMLHSFSRVPPVSRSSDTGGKTPARKHNLFKSIPSPKLPQIDLSENLLDDDDGQLSSKIELDTRAKLDYRPYAIVVKRWDGECFTLIANSTDYIEVLKYRIQSLTGISVEHQRLSFNGRPIDDSLQLGEQNIIEGSMLFLDPMKIHVQVGNQRFTLVVNPEDTIEKVKGLALNSGATTMYDKCVVFGGEELRTNRTLSECNIGHDDVLFIERFEISVMHWSGDKFSLPGVNSGHTMGEVKSRIFEMKKIPIGHQRITCNGKPTNDRLRLRDQRIKHKSILVMALPNAELQSPASSRVSTAVNGILSFRSNSDDAEIPELKSRVFFFDNQNRVDGKIDVTVLHWSGEAFPFNGIHLQESIDDIKQRIFEVKHIEKSAYRMRFLGNIVDDQVSLLSQKVGHKSILTMELLDEKFASDVPAVAKHDFGVLTVGTSQKITLIVQHWNGEMFLFEVDSAEYIDDVKDKIQETQLIPLRHQRLTFQGKPVDDAATLKEQNITHLSTLTLEPLEIRVKVPGGDDVIVPVDLKFTIGQVKKLVAEKLLGTPADSQNLSLCRQDLSDEMTLEQSDIDHDELLTLELFKIKALHWTGETIPLLGIGPNNTISDIKTVITKQLSVSIDQLRLSFNGRALEEHRTLKDQSIKHNSVLVIQSNQNVNSQSLSDQPKFRLSLLPKTGASFSATAQKIQISVKHWNGEIFSLTCSPTDYISDVKESINSLKGIPVDHQRLSFDGKLVDDEYTLHEQKVENNSTIVMEHLHIHIRILPEGKEVTIPIEVDYTIEKVKQLAAEAAGISMANPCISSGGKELLDAETLHQNYVDHDDVLNMEEFCISALHWTGEHVALPGIGRNDTISAVNNVLLEMLELSKDQYQLTLHGRLLDATATEKTLRDHGIEHKSILVVQDIHQMVLLSPVSAETDDKKKPKFQLSLFPKGIATPRLPNIAKATAVFGRTKENKPLLGEEKSSRRKSRSIVALFTSPEQDGFEGGTLLDGDASILDFGDTINVDS